MRARQLKPGLLKNEKLGSADPFITILFEGLWMMADREGRLEDRPLRICAEVFPYRRKITDKSIEKWLEWLRAEEFIERYEVGGKRFIQVLAFSKHQNPHKDERPSQIPALTSNSHRASTVHAQCTPDKSPEVVGLTPSSLTPDSPIPLSERDTRSEEFEFVGKVAPSKTVPTDLDAIVRVFEHWRTVHRHPQAKLDPRRLNHIRKMLASYSEADLCQAISGYCNSPHHMGQNDKATVYDDLMLLIRDAAHVDAGLRFYAEPPRTDLSEKTRRIVSQTETWTPPEVRNAAR